MRTRKKQAKQSLDLQLAQKASRRHSSRIRFLRHMLPAMAFFLFVGLFAWPYLENALYTPAPEEVKIVEESSVKNTLIKPRLNAFDGEGRPYRVVAETAHQKENNKADLTAPRGQILLKDGTALQVTSKEGQYDKECNSLDYKKEVHLDTSSGYHLVTDSAHVNFKNHSASGDKPLSGQGPAGQLSSEKGFIVQEETLYLLGPSKLVISQK